MKLEDALTGYYHAEFYALGVCVGVFPACFDFVRLCRRVAEASSSVYENKMRAESLEDLFVYFGDLRHEGV